MTAGWALALLLAPAGPQDPGPPTRGLALSMTLRPAEARLGEWVEAEVSGRLPSGAHLVEPGFQGAAGGFEILESGPLPAPEGTFRWRLRLVAFEPGPLVVPPLKFRVRGEGGAAAELSTAAVEVVVQQPGLAPAAELRPSRPPVGLPLTGLERLAVVLGIGIAVLALGLAARRRRRPTPQLVTPSPPPRERALGDLRELEREIPVPAPRAAEFYGRLVEVMRGFLAAAEGLAAFHMTSGQILDSVGSCAQPTVRRTLAELLGAADEVRFGGGLPDGPAQAGHIATAKDTVGSWRAAREGSVARGVD